MSYNLLVYSVLFRCPGRLKLSLCPIFVPSPALQQVQSTGWGRWSSQAWLWLDGHEGLVEERGLIAGRRAQPEASGRGHTEPAMGRGETGREEKGEVAQRTRRSVAKVAELCGNQKWGKGGEAPSLGWRD